MQSDVFSLDLVAANNSSNCFSLNRNWTGFQQDNVMFHHFPLAMSVTSAMVLFLK